MIAAARVDTSPVTRWHIADPANPEAPPAVVAYPVAGTANALVSLHVIALDGTRTEIEWDADAFEYLVSVNWSNAPLTLLVQRRNQQRWVVLTADPATGRTAPAWEDRDDAWLTIVPGVPAWTADGRLVMTADRDDTRRILIDGEPATPPGLHVQEVLHVGTEVVFRATGDDPLHSHLWRVSAAGDVERLTTQPGIHLGAASGRVVVDAWASMEHDGMRAEIRDGDGRSIAIASFAESPVLSPNVSFMKAGRREIRTAVLLPSNGWDGARLPVLLDPYGGPHFQRVLGWRRAYLESQWFADHGFAVLVIDGRGVDGRGPAWDRTMKFDFGLALEDQVDGLHAAGERYPFLDLTRVGIRGWSFGGYLSAMAVLRRPDVFRAAVVGAPVTDPRLYDTYYMERFLGHPDEHPDVYERNSLMPDAPKLERPVLLIHGLADDNVYVAHTLRFAEALFESGRPYELALIPNATHFTRNEAVTENLLRVQLEFLRRNLAL
jgi:dipeptidyl-peptidase-4